MPTVKTTARITLILYACLFPWQQVYSQAAFPEPNWDRASAVEAAQSVDPHKVLKSLYSSARTGDNRLVLDTLLTLEHNADWPVPAREYTIWSFTLGLADMEVNTVSPEVLDYLFAYRPQTLVAHDDRDNVGVPLFNIPTAAGGVRNSWARRHSAGRAEILLQSDPALWIAAYLKAGPAARRGFVDALDFASDEQLFDLCRSALEQLGDQPSLTAIAGKSALMLGDRELLQPVLALGNGPDLHHILKAASLSLDAESNKQLLFQTIRLGPDDKASLAIAQLAPVLLDDLDVREKMFQLLGNLSLGSSAALVLGSSTDPDIRDRLNTIAADKQGLTSQRASLAIGADRQVLETGQ